MNEINQNLACDQCAQAINGEPASHWSGGKVRFLCPSCFKTARSVARRKAWIALGVTAALLIIVPTVIIAAGLKWVLAYALMALGFLFGTGAFLVVGQRNIEPRIRLGALGVIAVSVAIGVVGILLLDPPTVANDDAHPRGANPRLQK